MQLRNIPPYRLSTSWITPENTTTPAALSSANSFTHSLRQTGRGGGTGFLLSLMWSYQVLPLDHLPRSALEFHAVLSWSPDNDTPLIVLGDFNIPPEKLCSPEFIDFICTFDLKLSPSPPTHQAGNLLDLVFTRSCSTLAPSITPLTVNSLLAGLPVSMTKPLQHIQNAAARLVTIFTNSPMRPPSPMTSLASC